MVMNNSDGHALCVPGFRLPHDHVIADDDPHFVHGIGGGTINARMTVKEIAMLGLMNSLTDKPDWQGKIKDEEIVSKWRKEALEIQFMSNEAFDWCLRELRENADKESDLTLVLDQGSRSIKADALIPSKLQQQLQDQIKPLLDGPKDFHPGSDDKVLDLVHPSLYPLVYGKTKVLDKGTVQVRDFLATPGPTTTVPEIEGNSSAYFSSKYQWLPCDVEFSGESGTEVSIASYINNLRPDRYDDLYRTIEKIIGYSIPAWNEVLQIRWRERTPLRIVAVSEAGFDPPREPAWIQELAQDEDDKKWKADLKRVRKYWDTPEAPLPSYVDPWRVKSFEEELQYQDDYLPGIASEKYKRIRKTIHPEPDAETYEEWTKKRQHQDTEDDKQNYPIQIENDFREKGLQVIVKLASIELTPEKPSYDGGNWHLEGAMNEHIVATSIYYFDTENITESRIRFRQEAALDEMDLAYEQCDHKPLSEIFGTRNMSEVEAVQEIGNLTTPEGRLLVFPNTLQHRVEPFQLVDPLKPGHRRILVLWLVDPHYRILSTRNVPPQQYDLWAEKAEKETKLKEKMPVELQKMILDEIKSEFMTFEQAQGYRQEIMDERVVNQEGIDSSYETYFLCEH